MDFTEIMKQYGLWAALCVFFIWQSWSRETKLADQLESSQKYIRESLSTVVRDNTEALRELKELLSVRPCLIPYEQIRELKKA